MLPICCELVVVGFIYCVLFAMIEALMFKCMLCLCCLVGIVGCVYRTFVGLEF